MIYLQPEIASGLSEDTFWTWFKREVPESSFDIPDKLHTGDVLLRYSTCPSAYSDGGKQVALCWELYPEMKRQLGGRDWDIKIERIYKCAEHCGNITVPSLLMKPFYEKYGNVTVLPIGVNTGLFRPIPDKQELRRRYGIPLGRRVGFWCGTDHEMKGFRALEKYARENPDIFWVLVWKKRVLRHKLNCQEFIRVTQTVLAQLMNCADFFLACGRLRPWFMVEWEAMACDLPCIDISGLERDVDAEGAESTRQLVFDCSWDRATALKLWLNYMEALP